MNTHPTQHTVANAIDKGGEKRGLYAILAGGVAALLASTCCLAPLVLMTLGFSSVGVSKLEILAPYQPLFIGGGLLALSVAGKRIWRPAAVCAPGEVCALPQVKRTYRMLFALVCALLLVAAVFPFVAHWF